MPPGAVPAPPLTCCCRPSPGLFLFLWLLGGIIKTNTTIKQQIALRRDYKASELLGTLAYVVANTSAVLYLTAPEQLWHYMLLQPPPSTFTVGTNAGHVLLQHRIISSAP